MLVCVCDHAGLVCVLCVCALCLVVCVVRWDVRGVWCSPNPITRRGAHPSSEGGAPRRGGGDLYHPREVRNATAQAHARVVEALTLPPPLRARLRP
jgi:hypothetical protein